MESMCDYHYTKSFDITTGRHHTWKFSNSMLVTLNGQNGKNELQILIPLPNIEQYSICIRALSLLPEGPVMLAVGLDMPKIETKTLGDVQHVAEVETYGVEQHRGHADFIQGPHIVTPAWMVWLPPAELHAKLTSTGREFNWHNPDWGQRDY